MATTVTLRKQRDTAFEDLETAHRQCRQDGRSVAELLGQLGGKWTVFIIVYLSHGPMRFSELKRRVEGISQKVLTATLRDLEKDGFVTRTVTPTIPPRVDYALTDLGHELYGPLRELCAWVVANRERVNDARRRFDASQRMTAEHR